MPSPQAPLKVLIVAEHASARFGGEAALPLHYFRLLLARGEPVWLITHERVRSELEALFPTAQDRIHYIRDTALHRCMWRVGNRLPARLAYFTTGFVSRLSTQLVQRRMAKALVAKHGIEVVHQPMPVSPKEPSILYGLGAPVIIGPLNGGMEYPPAFRQGKVRWVSRLAGWGRCMSNPVNRLMPGKPRAAAVLVANERTRRALPSGLNGKVVVLPENGVDLSLWGTPKERSPRPQPADHARFVFMGRLVDWKAVDILLHAFARAASQAAMSLTIIGDGDQGDALRALARQLGISGERDGEAGKVFFAGWQSQAACAERLADSDGLVLPSLWECGGAVVLEAMACRLPVIATAWGGPLDYLDASCGVLVPPDSREGLERGIEQGLVRLSRSPTLRREMGTNGRRRVEAEFDWDRKMDVVMRLYQEVAGRGHPKAGAAAGAGAERLVATP